MTFLFFIILVLLIIKPDVSSIQVLEGCNLWISTLVPIMFPSFICIDMITNSKIIIKLSKLLYPFLNKLFNINSEASSFIILISILCGAPASTKLIVNNLNNNKITKDEADNLISSFSFLSLPFIILVLKEFKYVIIFYIGQLLFSMLFMKINNKKDNKRIISYEIKNNLELFTSSIKKNIEILLNILGIIIFFRIIINLFINNDFFLYSYIEILGGLNKLNINHDKFLIFSSLGFLGLSIHFQILSIYPKLNYFKFVSARFFLLLTGLLITFLL